MIINPLHLISFATILLFMMIPNPGSAQLQDKQSGLFDGHSDIGNIELPGSIDYNAEKQEYTIEGSGSNIWFANDEFQYAWKKIKGNFILTAKVEFVGQGVEAIAKSAGWYANRLTLIQLISAR